MNLENKNPEISIIVPIYNCEDTLSKCIESILKQTFNNFELILIDDGSNDKSGYICDIYSKKDSRIRVYHNKNQGVSSSRNYGINISNGKYLMFCDGDDYVDINWCKELYQQINIYPDSWICCNFSTVDNNTGKEERNVNSLKEINFISKNDFFVAVDLGISGFCWNKIFDKEIINKHKIRFNESYSLGEDVEFCVDYLKRVKNIIVLNKYLYCYVKYSKETLTNKKYENYFDLLRHFYNLRRPFISDMYLEKFCNIYYYEFYYALADKMKSNTEGFFRRLKDNQRAINTNEFIDCLKNIENCEYDKIERKLFKYGNYYIFYIYKKIYELIKIKK